MPILQEPYNCPISMDPPRVPVITNEGITYDFVSIARSLLREDADNSPAFNPTLDPTTHEIINVLIYNRSTKKLNDSLMGEVLPLSNEEKNEMASLYTQLTTRYPTLQIRGIHTLEGMQALIGAPMAIDSIITRPEFAPDFVDQDGRTSLYLAAKEGVVNVVRQLLTRNEVNPNQGMTLARLSGATPLIIAAEKGHVPVVTTLLADPRVLPNQAKADGATPLFIAALKGHAPVVTTLLADPRVLPNQANTGGGTPLFIAAENGHVPVVTTLLADPRVLPNQANTRGGTPLFIAAQNGHVPVVTTLLADPRVLPNQAKAYGATPLFIAALKGHAPVVTALLADSRVAPNQADEDGATPLLIAAQKGHAPVVTALLADHRVHPNQAMSNGATPLYTAALFGHLDIVQSLLPRLNTTTTNNLLSTTAQNGYSAFVHALLSDETIRNGYLNQIIIKPELMRDAFTKNPIFFTKLSEHRTEIWARLREPVHFNLPPDEYKALLRKVLDSRQEQNKALRHPLYTLFESPRSIAGFFGMTTNILDDIRAHLDTMPPHEDWTYNPLQLNR